MRWLLFKLCVFACSLSSSALAVPRQIRTSLDDVDAPAPSATQRSEARPSPGAFALGLGQAPRLPSGRLIRLSLDDGPITYGHLAHPVAAGRRIRTTLD